MSEEKQMQINEETIKALVLAVNTFKSVLDRCVNNGKIFNSLDEAVVLHIHLKNLDSLVFHTKKNLENEKK